MSNTQTVKSSEKPMRFWNIAQTNGDEATLTLYGDVVDQRPVDFWTGEAEQGLYICPEDFMADLEQIKDKKTINIKINSLGGTVYTAVAIHNALKALPAIKNVIVEGIAASAASVIAMVGDKIKMYPGSLMMIHNVSGFFMDYMTITDLKKAAKGFDAIERAIAAIYAGKTGLDETTIRNMMDKETWMTGQEAVDKKFADELLSGSEPVMQYSPTNHLLVVNGVQHHTDGLKIPERFKIQPMPATAAATVSNQPKNPKGENIMTLDELKAQYPELVAQIEAEAVEKDRARIQEIEEIQNTIGDPDMIAAAKFTKPTNAAQLALAAMKKQAALGSEFLKNRAEEQKPADKVQAAAQQVEDPLDLAKATKEQEKAAIKNVADQYKKIFK